jgi:hypothetical protein
MAKSLSILWSGVQSLVDADTSQGNCFANGEDMFAEERLKTLKSMQQFSYWSSPEGLCGFYFP